MARYFIDRPIFAWVISLGIVLAGLLADPGQLDGVRAAARAYRDPAPFDPEDDDGRPV